MKNFKRLMWAIRKTRLPVEKSALVLDVGSGGNPHPRADVLIDRLIGAEHRGGDPMLIDRPAIIGDATKLPFKDKAFDYVIASHVLEHMPDPAKFLSELQRVAKAGYIETPNYICERFIPSHAHCLEVALCNNKLIINKKTEYLVDSYISNLDYLESNKRWGDLYFDDPDLFHVRYFWENEINYEIANPHVSCDWIEDVYKNSSQVSDIVAGQNNRTGWRALGSTIYGALQQRLRKARLKNLNLNDLLVCSECRGALNAVSGGLACHQCEVEYATNPHVNFENGVSCKKLK
jgi:SAM-dependent methyltransferase